MPADLRARGRADARADRTRDQLRAEADAEQRHLAVDRLADEVGLVGEPRVLAVLVGVHRAAEHHDRVVVFRSVEGRGVVRDADAVEPVAALLDDVLEQPAATRRGGLVDDREDAHGASLAPLPAFEE